MPQEIHDEDLPAHALPVYLAEQFRVVNGANLGGTLSFADEIEAEDVYDLAPDAEPRDLGLLFPGDGTCHIAASSTVGRPGATVYPDCCLTIMPTTGETVELIILVEVDAAGDIAEVYAAPLAPLQVKIPYTLIGIDRDTAMRRLALSASVSFTRGTRITTLEKGQVRVEDLQEGDRVLTRDDGAQEIRWIGRSTVRAHGAFAPVVIAAGTLHNDADLVVSPDQRLLIYQRADHLGAGRPDLLVRARHLVNGTTVTRRSGGFVDYFQLVFDRHQIIFAEGICAETMKVDSRTRTILPEDLDRMLAQKVPGKSRLSNDMEVAETLLRRADAVEILHRATRG